MNQPAVDLDGLMSRSAEAFFVRNPAGKTVFHNRAFTELVGAAPNDPTEWSRVESELLAVPDDLPPGEWRLADRPWQSGGPKRWLNVAFFRLSESQPNAAAETIAVLGFVRATRPIGAGAPTKAADSLVPERLARLREEQVARWGFHSLPARGAAMQRVLDQARLAIETKAPVAIIGEPGTGKHSLARTIHHQQFGGKGSFASLNCRALPPDIQRQQLLGRFDVPNARSAEAFGLLHAPGSGTLLIQHPLDLAPDLQEEIVKASADAARSWRLIVTETVPLEDGVRDGRLTETFFYQTSTMTIRLPPLRARRAELTDHCHWILERRRQGEGSRTVGIDPGAMDVLSEYEWPGNLRELETVLDAAAQRAGGALIARADLPRRLRSPSAAARAESTIPDEFDPHSSASGPVLPSLDELLEEVERRMFKLALARFRGNKSKAAEYLRISRPRFHRRCEQFGLSSEDS